LKKPAYIAILIFFGIAIVGALVELAISPTPAAAGGETAEHTLSIPTILFFFCLSALILVILSIKATRRLSLRPLWWQNGAEQVVESFEYLSKNTIGEAYGRKYASLLGTAFIFILVMNLIGLMPWGKSPTANLNVTVSLAIACIILVHIYSIREAGIKRYISHYFGEIWWLWGLMPVLHIIGELAKPLSLSIRLFGNIFGEDMVIVILMMMGAYALPMFVPIPLQLPMMLFGVFTAFVQALVFTMLIGAYIGSFVAHD
jgi:F-type H+-transporting ATPase subunit a